MAMAATRRQTPRFSSPSSHRFPAMRAMAFVWGVILVGGIAYFSIVGLTHH
jgi:hypothetical protein